MGYYLGIDLGTTFTGAAVSRNGRVDVCGLGTRAPVIPSVVVLRDDGSVLTGEAAERRAASEPHRVAREFKRRVGDPTPIIIGGTPHSAEALTAKLLRAVVAKVSEKEGGAPDGVAVCHPANWGDFKKDLLGQAISLAGLEGATMVTEPQAAALHYASQERVESGAVVAVYDLGGGTFDAAVLRKENGGFAFLGEAQGIERLGGVDFDEAVFQHVTSAVGEAVQALDPQDPTVIAAVSRLRRECVAAKEGLSSDTDVSIPVMLPNLQTVVRLTRAEFEAMIRPALTDSILVLRRTLESAHVSPGDVSAVLLVGGSSRIPLVAQLVGAELGRPVAVDADPKHGTALGAAMTATARASAAPTETTPAAAAPAPIAPTVISSAAAAPTAMTPTAATRSTPATPAAVAPTAMTPTAPTGPAALPGAPPSGERPGMPGVLEVQRRRLPMPAIVGGVVLLLLAVVLFAANSGGGDDDGTETTGNEDQSTSLPSSEDELTPGAEDESQLLEPESFDVDKVVWWGGFEITVESVEITADEEMGTNDLAVSVAFVNQLNRNNSLDAEVWLGIGDQSGPTGSYQTLPEVPGGGQNRDVVTFSLSGYEVTDVDDLVLTFGEGDQNQALVPLGEGEAESFEPVAFDVQGTLSTPKLEVSLGAEGSIQPSFTSGEQSLYLIRVPAEMDFLPQEDFDSLDVGAADFTLTAPTGDTATASSDEEGDFSSWFALEDEPNESGTLAFKLRDPGPGEYTLTYTQDGGRTSNEVTFTIPEEGGLATRGSSESEDGE